MTKTMRAQIKGEGEVGTIDLFWNDGDIWAREQSGKEYPTQTGCENERDADEVIQAAWGSGGWGLVWAADL